MTYANSAMAARRLAEQAHQAEQERDALAAKLNELEGQEPVGRYYWESVADATVMAVPSETTPHYMKDDFPLFARPAPADPVNAQLLSALKGMVAIHDEPAGFDGKYGQALTKALEQTQQKIDARLMAARSALAAAESQQAEPVRLTDEEIAKTCKSMLVVGYCGGFLEDDGSLLAKKIEAMTLRANGFKAEC